MTRNEMLLVCLMEECSEVAQRASKALRFGLAEIEPGQEDTNGERITLEMIDLQAVFEMLSEATGGAVPFIHKPAFNENVALAAKRAKIEKYFAYSKECGTIQGE